MEKHNILGVDISATTYEEVVNKVDDFVSKSPNKHYIVTPNPEIVLHARKDDEYRKILNFADVAIPDGTGLLFAARLFGKPIASRVTGSDLVWKLCDLAEKKRYKVYFLGGRNDTVAKRASKKILDLFPKLHLVGAEGGGEVSKDGAETDDTYLIEKLNFTKPEILFVAFGAPKQEKWIYRNLDKLESVKVAIGVGGALDFIAGDAKRAPAGMRKLGLEWLYRAIKQPWRLPRILKATVAFPLVAIRCRIGKFFYRRNVAALIFSKHGKVLIAKNMQTEEWMLPQGGIDRFENADKAVHREVSEEVGLTGLRIVKKIPRFNKYDWPEYYQNLLCHKGQKQTLFLAFYPGEETDVRVDNVEIDEYKWVDKDQVAATVSEKRREAAERAIQELYKANQEAGGEN